MRRSAALKVDGQFGAHSVDVEVGGVADTAYLPSEPVSLNTANASLIRDGEMVHPRRLKQSVLIRVVSRNSRG